MPAAFRCTCAQNSTISPCPSGRPLGSRDASQKPPQSTRSLPRSAQCATDRCRVQPEGIASHNSCRQRRRASDAALATAGQCARRGRQPQHTRCDVHVARRCINGASQTLRHAALAPEMRRERQPRARSRRVLDRALRAASGGGISTVQAGGHSLRALPGAARRCRPALPRSEASGVSACRSRVIAADSSCGQASAGPAEAHAQPSVRSGLWRDLTMARTGRGGAGGIGTCKGRAPHISGLLA